MASTQLNAGKPTRTRRLTDSCLVNRLKTTNTMAPKTLMLNVSRTSSAVPPRR